MTQQNFCKHCLRKHGCGQLYRQPADITGPSVAGRVMIAFVAPLLVFIGSLAGFEALSGPATNTPGMHTVISLILAGAVTSTCIFLIKAISTRLHKNMKSSDS